MIRSKRNLSCEARLDVILQQPIFKKLLKQNPNIRTKIVVLNGTLTEPQLNITNKNILNDLYENIELVIHSAANVSFLKPFIDTIKTNVYGTNVLLKLCKNMKNLKAFLYVSTAFSQLHQTTVDEKFYEPIIEPDILLKFLDKFTNENDMQNLTTIIMKFLKSNHINYTLSKGICEALVRSYGNCFPIAVIRPSAGMRFCK